MKFEDVKIGMMVNYVGTASNHLIGKVGVVKKIGSSTNITVYWDNTYEYGVYPENIEPVRRSVEPTKLHTATTYGVFKKARVMFNGNATILEIGDFKTVVKCDEKDKFSYYIGLGLALSRYYEKQPDTKIEIKYLKDELNYKKLAHYCLHKYFSFDTKRVDKFLKSCEKCKWVDLC